jgi:NAD+ kinase
MSKADLVKLVIFGDPKKGRVAEAIEEFISFVRGRAKVIAKCRIEECKVGVLKEADFAIVFGGDGSIISAARSLSQSGVPVVGVNLGKLGFLAEFSVGEVKRLFGDIISGKAAIERRMMLSCSIVRGDIGQQTCGNDTTVVGGGKQRFCSEVINDIFITAGPPFRMIELRMSVDGQALADCVGDGLIICTPTGSSAYNLSAGGPILSAKMDAMVITPICPHSLSFRPIVIGGESKVDVFGIRVNEGTTVSIDGQVSCKLSSDDIVRIERSKDDFLIVNNPLRTQWDTLASKLNWAEKPKYEII